LAQTQRASILQESFAGISRLTINQIQALATNPSVTGPLEEAFVRSLLTMQAELQRPESWFPIEVRCALQVSLRGSERIGMIWSMKPVWRRELIQLRGCPVWCAEEVIRDALLSPNPSKGDRPHFISQEYMQWQGMIESALTVSGVSPELVQQTWHQPLWKTWAPKAIMLSKSVPNEPKRTWLRRIDQKTATGPTASEATEFCRHLFDPRRHAAVHSHLDSGTRLRLLRVGFSFFVISRFSSDSTSCLQNLKSLTPLEQRLVVRQFLRSNTKTEGRLQPIPPLAKSSSLTTAEDAGDCLATLLDQGRPARGEVANLVAYMSTNFPVECLARLKDHFLSVSDSSSMAELNHIIQLLIRSPDREVRIAAINLIGVCRPDPVSLGLSGHDKLFSTVTSPPPSRPALSRKM